MSELRLQAARFTDPDAQALIDLVQAEYVERYGSPDETPLDPTMFDPPAGAFFVAYDGETPVATGGWKRRTDVTAFGSSLSAEIKRMFVVAGRRGEGISRVVLAHLEDTARAAGAEIMVLETATRQPEAISLYESSGYTPVPAFGYYAEHKLSRYLGKPLRPSSGSIR